MGLPIDMLLCASNENKVLYDFFKSGTYDRNREFILTSSPSMDILISSNLERLIYHLTGDDADQNRAFMESLSREGRYAITPEMKEQLSDFYGNYASEEETAAVIADIYRKDGYVIDTHTAVAADVYRKYRKERDNGRKTVIASTASPFKFTRSVMKAIDSGCDDLTDFQLVDRLSELSQVKVPKAIEEIRTAAVLHDTVVEKDGMKGIVERILGIH